MNAKQKATDSFEKSYLVIALLGFIYVIFGVADPNYSNIFLLPLGYFIINGFGKILQDNNLRRKGTRYQGGIAYVAALSVIFIRYVIAPISIVATGNYSGIGVDPTKSNLDFAIFLMLMEMLAVTITMQLAIHYYAGKGLKNPKTAPASSISRWQRMPLRITVIAFAVLALLLILVCDYRLIIPRNMFVVDINSDSIANEVELSGGIPALACILKTVLLFIGLSWLKLKHINTGKSRYIILSFGVALIYMGMMTSTKRWEMLFAGILCLFMLQQLYKKIPKFVFIAIITLMALSIISISTYKFAWYLKDSLNPFHDILVYLSGSFQAYFSGARNVAQAIDMKTLWGPQITVLTLMNDFLGSVPLLCDWINQANRINVYFNLYNNLDNTSQIIPMVGIGYCYFPFLAPLFSMICEWFVIKTDYCIQKTNRIEFKTIFCHLGFYLALCMAFNTQIIFSFVITRFFPLYLLFAMNRKISL
jgi:hypothetical protein